VQGRSKCPYASGERPSESSEERTAGTLIEGRVAVV
jgi:hypothetical protein